MLEAILRLSILCFYRNNPNLKSLNQRGFTLHDVICIYPDFSSLGMENLREIPPMQIVVDSRAVN